MDEGEQSVNGDGPGPDEAGEMYFNTGKGEWMRRRGHRAGIRRGPRSSEEDMMRQEWHKLVSDSRRLHGAVAQTACLDVLVIVARIRVVMQRNSFEITGNNVGGFSRHWLLEELDFAEPPELPQDEDVFEGVEMEFDPEDPELYCNFPRGRMRANQSARSADVRLS